MFAKNSAPNGLTERGLTKKEMDSAKRLAHSPFVANLSKVCDSLSNGKREKSIYRSFLPFDQPLQLAPLPVPLQTCPTGRQRAHLRQRNLARKLSIPSYIVPRICTHCFGVPSDGCRCSCCCSTGASGRAPAGRVSERASERRMRTETPGAGSFGVVWRRGPSANGEGSGVAVAREPTDKNRQTDRASD